MAGSLELEASCIHALHVSGVTEVIPAGEVMFLCVSLLCFSHLIYS